MNFEIEHLLKYTYQYPVKLNPQYFYLSPSISAFQTLISHDLIISPIEDILIKNVDQESNIQHIYYQNKLVNEFTVKSIIKIESPEINSLNFIFYPFECSKLPFKYPAKLSTYVNLAIKQKNIGNEVKAYTQSLLSLVKNDTIDFIMRLTEDIKNIFTYVPRQEGEAQLSTETFLKKTGTCRDYAVFMIDCCGAAGLLARFVSGYFMVENKTAIDLHAWVEVLLPGGGWRGFDPTEGKAINNRYLALANSIEHRGLVPLRGSFKVQKKTEVEFESYITFR